MDGGFRAPSHPNDIPLFVSGLAAVGARVIGVGDQHVDALPERSRQTLSSYVQIDSWGDEDAAVDTVLQKLQGRNVDLVETLWEPTLLMAARLREAIGLPGMTVQQTVPFRDKGEMKKVVEAAGLRTPRSVRTSTRDGCRAAA